MLLNARAIAAGTLVVCHVTTAQATPWERTGTERVRPLDRRLQYVLHQGAYRSSTFRHLLRALESSELIVYVAPGRCLNPAAAGCLVFQGASAGQRYVRILVNPVQPTDRLIIILVHELQHALEVTRAPSVVDEASLAAHFHAIGTRSASRSWVTYETEEGVAAAARAAAELKAARAAHPRARGAVAADCETIERFCLCDSTH